MHIKLGNKEWLRREYIDKARSQKDIGLECGVKRGTVSKYVIKHGFRIPILERRRMQLKDIRLRDANWIKNEYIIKNKTLKEIAKELGFCKQYVCHWIKRHKIIKRAGRDFRVKNKRLLDADWLKNEYIVKGRSAQSIASECGVCLGVALKWIRRNNIKTRETGNPKLCNKEWMSKQYERKKLTSYQIGKLLGVHSTTVLKWLRKHGIKIKSIFLCGPEHPNWRGTTSQRQRTLTSPRWNRLKSKIIKRDQTCLLCGSDKKLVGHHIIPVWDAPLLEFDDRNICALCKPCHIGTYGKERLFEAKLIILVEKSIDAARIRREQEV